MRRDMDKLTQAVKEVAVQHGAVLVGIAPIERFDLRSMTPRPRGITPGISCQAPDR